MYVGQALGRRPLGRWRGLGQVWSAEASGLPPDLLDYYRNVLQIHFGPRPFIPGHGEVASMEAIPDVLRSIYGTERPPLGSPVGATGVIKLGGVWTWWFGVAPPQPGTSAALSYRPIPPSQPGSFPSPTVEGLFPELADVVAVDVTATEDYQRAKQAEQERQRTTAIIATEQAAGQYREGDRSIIGGRVVEWQDGQWVPIVAEPGTPGYQTPVEMTAPAGAPSSLVPVPRTQPPTVQFPGAPGEPGGEPGGTRLTAGATPNLGLLLAGISVLFLVLVPGKRAGRRTRR